jgi:hypothetical protein
MGDRGIYMQSLGGKTWKKIPLSMPRLKREYNIKTDLIGVGWGVMDWIYMAQDGGQCRDFMKKVRNNLI